MNCFIKVVRDNTMNFEGRAGRREFWMFFIWYAAIGVAAWGLDHYMNAFNFRSGIGFFISVWFFGLLLPFLAAIVRRLHDTGRSGWWVFLLALPVVGWALLTLFCSLRGDDSDNAYGPLEPAYC